MKLPTNNVLATLRRYLRSPSISVLVGSFGFWACFWLILFGLQHLPVSPFTGERAYIGASLAIAATLFLIFGFLRFDGGSSREVGLIFTSKSLLQFMLGAGLGFMLVAIMISALLLLTPLEIVLSVDDDTFAIIWTSFLVMLTLALMEELAFRSYPLFRLRESWGIRPAIYVSSIVFAFYHGFAIGNLLGPGIWGLFFGWMAISTNSIALPTGFHFGLNWLQALVGMKPQYGASIWEFSIGSRAGFVDTETLGIIMQVILLFIGVLMIENLARKQDSRRR